MSKIMEHFISADEAEIYDRQIRLWGVEAQKSLRRASILVIGCRGLGAEVCKDVLLAGVKELTVLDDGELTLEDTCSQMLVTQEQIGKNRAEASLKRMQLMNPMVDIKIETGSVVDKPDAYFSNFNVICATECDLRDLNRINYICNKNDIKFFCGDIYGIFGYFFEDLGHHEYIVETIVQPPVKKDKNMKPVQEEPEIKREKKKTDFVSLEDALGIDFKEDAFYKNKISKMDPSYFLVQILNDFHREKQRKPKPETHDQDVTLLKTLRQKYLDELKIPDDKISDVLLENLFAQLPFTCGIVGGVLSQEIIKAITKQGKPHQNMFFFNPEKCVGFAENYAPTINDTKNKTKTK